MKYNKKKAGEFELAKAIAILGLPFIHFLEEAGLEYGFLLPEVENIIEPICFLTIFGPAVFMLCMGFAMGGSYNWKRLQKNGIQFLIIGYSLNTFCFAIPYFIIWARGGDRTLEAAVRLMFNPDIYVFVGWFYVFYSILRRCKATSLTTFLVTFCMLLTNSFTGHFVELPDTIPARIIGNFITVNDSSFFPLFGWAIFPFVGIWLGDALKKYSNEEYHFTMKRLLFGSVAGLAAFSLVLYAYGVSPMDILLNFTNSYILDLFTVILLLLTSSVVIGIMHMLYQLVPENPFERAMLKISPFIMSFYLIQWLVVSAVVYYGLLVFDAPKHIFGLGASFSVMFSMWLISFECTYRHGFAFLRFVLTKSDYTKWFRKKKKVHQIA
ncbi:MAG: hypothetical protein Q4B85_10610 [Lachnospiraceae bacterium]|nr:hypothetical protein [Lachnospiraceae bacterium]